MKQNLFEIESKYFPRVLRQISRKIQECYRTMLSIECLQLYSFHLTELSITENILGIYEFAYFCEESITYKEYHILKCNV